MSEVFTNKFRTFKSVSKEIIIVGLIKVLTTLVTHSIFKDYNGKQNLKILLPIVFVISTIIVLFREFLLFNKRRCDNYKYKKGGISFIDKVLDSLISSLMFIALLVILYIFPFNKSFRSLPLNFLTTFSLDLIKEYIGFNKWLCKKENQVYGTYTLN